MGKLMTCSYHFDSASITDVRSVNDSFALGTLDIMYLGENPNGTNFDLEPVKAALPSLRNVPIVCNYDPDEKTIGGHDFDVAKDEDGSLYLRPLTTPIGVVTDHSKLSFVEKEDGEGETHTYLRAEDVVLWKRQEAVRYITNDLDGKIDHSMEIDVTDGEKMESGAYNVKAFQFVALCLLGNCKPCFDGSELSIYSNENGKKLKEQIAEMMHDIAESYSMIAAAAEDSGDNTITTSKGGEKHMDENQAMNFEATAQAEEPVAEPTTEPATNDVAMQFELNNNLRDSIRRAIDEPKVIRWGEEYRKYWLVDYDVAANMVYAEESCTGKLYGFPYTMDGDNVVVDFENGTRKKFAIVDYNDGDAAADTYSQQVSEDADAMIAFADKAKADYDAAAAEIETYKQQIETANTELTELREFKANVEATEAAAAKEAVFAKFTDLCGTEMFEALKEAADMTAEALEEKCYAIRGRLMTAAQVQPVAQTYSAKATTKIAVDKTDSETEKTDDKPYGGIVEQYT